MPTKRKIIFGTLSLLLIVWMTKTEGLGALMLVESAKAGDATEPFFTIINQFMGWVAVVAHFLIYILTAICGMLLDPSFINLRTDGQSMGATLLKIWQISRNITNILLAFMLIIGAILTVVFAEGGYVQKYAVKFVLAVVLVNFSWFFPRVVLDLANILTATVYSIPSAINTPCVAYDKTGKVDPGGCKVVTDYAFFQKGPGLPPGMTSCPVFFDKKDRIICIKEERLDNGANTPNAIMGALVYNHARFKYFEQVVKPPAAGPGGGANPLAGPATLSNLPQLLIFTLLMSMMLFFSFALLFPLLALTLVLLIRIPIIWITVAFMPFMFIGFVAGDSGALKAFNPMEIWNKFLHAAFIPVVSAIPFSIGFIMINVAASAPPPDNAALTRQMGIPMIPGVANLWQLIWVGMAIAVVWMGAKAAFKIDALFEKFAAPIMSAGGSMGKLMMKLPLLLPLPLPGGATPLGALRVAANPEQAFIDPMGKFRMPEILGGGGGAGAAAAAATKVTNHVNANVTIQNDLRNQVNAFNGAADDAARQTAFNNIRQKLDEIARRENVKLDTGNKQTVDEILRKISAATPAAGINNLDQAHLGKVR
ncbi:MAG: hypothetical protein Q7S29_00890 [Candidatus Peribacter sp.]|nr:hypothetical protein [Candidatus Peribacter sp.]